METGADDLSAQEIPVERDDSLDQAQGKGVTKAADLYGPATERDPSGDVEAPEARHEKQRPARANQDQEVTMEQTLSGLEELLTPEAIAEERARVLTPGKRIENVDELFGLFADLDDPGAVDALEALREEQRPARCRCVAAAEG